MGILGFIFNSLFGRSSLKVSLKTKERILSDWKNIDTLLAGKSPSQLRQAVIVADKTLDAALKELVLGDTMGERLKNSRDLFDSVDYNKIWDAHKVRNALVHEVGYDPSYHIITRAVENLRNGLKELGVKV